MDWFLTDTAIPPTNNRAERDLRPSRKPSRRNIACLSRSLNYRGAAGLPDFPGASLCADTVRQVYARRTGCICPGSARFSSGAARARNPACGAFLYARPFVYLGDQGLVSVQGMLPRMRVREPFALERKQLD